MRTTRGLGARYQSRQKSGLDTRETRRFANRQLARPEEYKTATEETCLHVFVYAGDKRIQGSTTRWTECLRPIIEKMNCMYIYTCCIYVHYSWLMGPHPELSERGTRLGNCLCYLSLNVSICVVLCDLLCVYLCGLLCAFGEYMLSLIISWFWEQGGVAAIHCATKFGKTLRVFTCICRLPKFDFANLPLGELF